ncbi:MAG: hypothetical protein QM572_05425, partial [Nocardioides sp.]|uniref:hypothetical protein n=1 Tax=Nocardioides sp. TaxID=35761 RepID=UPI0039E2F35B
ADALASATDLFLDGVALVATSATAADITAALADGAGPAPGGPGETGETLAARLGLELVLGGLVP